MHPAPSRFFSPEGHIPEDNQSWRSRLEQVKDDINEDTIDDSIIIRAAKKAGRHRSEDRLGWRSEYWRPLLGSDALKDLRFSIIEFLRGECTDHFYQSVAGSRLTALSKPDNRGIRPIGITDVLRKLAGRVLNILYRDHIRDSLISQDGRVLQFGVGHSHGAQMCAMAAQEHLRLHPQHAIFSLDLKNAFNCVSREAIALGINRLGEKQGRAMLGFCLAMYSRTNSLSYFLSTGERKSVDAKTGVTQGCVLGSAFFCLAIQPIIEEARVYLRPRRTRILHRRRH